jgi:hypothetical protein
VELVLLALVCVKPKKLSASPDRINCALKNRTVRTKLLKKSKLLVQDYKYRLCQTSLVALAVNSSVSLRLRLLLPLLLHLLHLLHLLRKQYQ